MAVWQTKEDLLAQLRSTQHEQQLDAAAQLNGFKDHVLDAEAIAKNTGASIISNFEIVSWYEGKGINGHPMNHGGKFEFDFVC